MPFPFGAVCDLLQRLENDHNRKRNQTRGYQIVAAWFAEHRQLVDHRDTDKCALLSTLLPEKRTDRVYNIQQRTLSAIFARAQRLGYTRERRLKRYLSPGSGVDLAECIEDILKETPNPIIQDVTVEEIDQILQQLASGIAFSSPAIRLLRSTDRSTQENREALSNIFVKLSATEAKWFTRLVLKRYLPVMVPERAVYAQCHKLLPDLLKVYGEFTVAFRVLQQKIQDGRTLDKDLDRAHMLRLVKPQVGVKVGRQDWLKGRSIKHCLEMGRGLMSVEKKMDGEYCQVHVDLSKGSKCIQIFSKSGKDSTEDRYKLHGAIKSALGIGTSSCNFERECILEGEMVLYSNKDGKGGVLGFDKIRKHVRRSGRNIGTAEDSQAHDHEHLMIVWFDVLLIDDESLLNVRHSERFRRLSRLVYCHKGKSALVQRQIVDFSSRVAAEELRKAFDSCIRNRDEGLVLKADDPYFAFGSARHKYTSCCIKMKTGYIKGMGEVGDFAVVGARYDATKAKMLKIPHAKYTHFYLGCLTNSEEVRRFPDVVPDFTVVNEVELSAANLQYFRLNCFTHAVASVEENDAFLLNIPPGILQGKKIAAVFKEPAVFEMASFSFQKAPNTRFWSLRFPVVTKVHRDRMWKECMSFEDLQRLAEEETTSPEKEDRRLGHFSNALKEVDPNINRVAVDQETQQTSTTVSTVSTARSSCQSHMDQVPAKVSRVTAARPGLTTKPTSSASAPSGSSPQGNSSLRTTPRKRKRVARPSSPRCTRPRRDEPEVTDLTVSTPTSNHRARQPFEDITSAHSSQGNVSSALVPRLPRAETFHGMPDIAQLIQLPTKLPMSSSFPSAASPSSLLNIPTESAHGHPAARGVHSDLFLATTKSASSCRHAGRFCALANRAVLLSPHVADLPVLTEDLLPSHGISAVFTDIASLFNRTKSLRKSRAVVLVDGRRREATHAFLRELEADPTRGRDGLQAVIPAYDWRLLEAITAEERNHGQSSGGASQINKTVAHGREVWNRYYVGLC